MINDWKAGHIPQFDVALPLGYTNLVTKIFNRRKV